MRPFLEILGACYIYLNGEDQLIQRFNYCVANRLLMFIDEVQVNDPKVYNKIKGIISEPTITMEPKGIDVFQVPNLARLVFTSNHERVLIAQETFPETNLNELTLLLKSTLSRPSEIYKFPKPVRNTTACRCRNVVVKTRPEKSKPPTADNHAKQWPQAYGCKTTITQDPFARLEPK